MRMQGLAFGLSILSLAVACGGRTERADGRDGLPNVDPAEFDDNGDSLDPDGDGALNPLNPLDPLEPAATPSDSSSSNPATPTTRPDPPPLIEPVAPAMPVAEPPTSIPPLPPPPPALPPTEPGFGELPEGQPWPEGCDNGFYENFEFGCFTQLECEQGEFAFVNCDGRGDQAQCFCEGSGGVAEVDVGGVPAGEACAYAAQECLEPSIDESDDVDCDLVGQSFSRDHCDLTRNCALGSRQTEDGVTLTSQVTDGVGCFADPSVGWNCNCWGGGQFLLGDNADVCEVALSVCDEIDSEEFGAPECTQDSLFASRFDCSINDQCLRSGTTPSGVDVQAIEYQSVSCYNASTVGAPGIPFPVPVPFGESPGQSLEGQDNEWTCSCSGSRGLDGETFMLDGEESLEVCLEASTICGY